MSSIVLILLLVSAAPENPDELIRRGLDLRKEGHNEEALALFERAHAAAPTPRSRAQLALAKQSLARWVDAEIDLDAALSHRSDPWIERHRDLLEQARETIRAHLGWLEVTTDAVSAELFIDGTRTSTLPSSSPLRVVAKKAVVEVRHPKHLPARRELEISAGATMRIYVRLVPLPASDPPMVVAVEPSTSSASVGAQELAGWIAAGGAVLAIGGAIAAHAVRERSAAIYNDDARCFFGELSRDQRCGEYRARTETTEKLAIAGYTLGGLAAGAAVWLLVSAPKQERIACVPSELGMRCALVW